MTTPQDPPPARMHFVLSHLSFAVAVVDACWIEVGEERMPGRLGQPDAETGTVVVRFDRNAAALPYVPDVGTPIRVSYQAQGEAYAWVSRVVKTEDATAVRCALPDQVEREDRRAAPRIRVLGWPNISLDVRIGGSDEERVALVDLSTGGVALLALKGRLAAGDQLLGRLAFGDEDVLRVVLEVVGTRDGPQDEALVHCLFASITDMSRKRIAEEVYRELRSDK
ncbi:MAG: PilZ domain-containing protein [Myxococcota bacterium]|nr:PilZ domain-containing protein [Myxococcota bacterium]MEC8423007.1 PilZ domain-containing protein [Myxococcota bacterium]